jgi:hypothetical protein
MDRLMKRIGGISLIALLLFACATREAVERFEGKMVYKLSSDKLDRLATDSINYQVIYAKDSMLRIENFTPIGKQIYIKHIPKNRAYILMEFNGQKIAIQSIPEPAVNDGKYLFKKRRGKVTVAGIEAKKIDVTLPEIDTMMTMLYHPRMSADYSEAIPGIPGMPLRYALLVDGVLTTFELLELEERVIDIDFFGIPSDYERMTMDEFIERMMEME